MVIIMQMEMRSSVFLQMRSSVFLEMRTSALLEMRSSVFLQALGQQGSHVCVCV